MHISLKIDRRALNCPIFKFEYVSIQEGFLINFDIYGVNTLCATIHDYLFGKKRVSYVLQILGKFSKFLGKNFAI
jgi:hypothetical protein